MTSGLGGVGGTSFSRVLGLVNNSYEAEFMMKGVAI